MLLSDWISPAVLFPGKFTVYGSQGCEWSGSCCQPSPMNWEGGVMGERRSAAELAVLRAQARAVEWLDLPLKIIGIVVIGIVRLNPSSCT